MILGRHYDLVDSKSCNTMHLRHCTIKLSVPVVLDTMSEVVDQAGQDAQLELLRNHPDLAGKLAVSGKLTAASASEQAGAGLDRCTDAEFDEFTKLNNRYQQRFGFPFIVAVRGLDKERILEQFRHRVQNDWDTEFDCALSQVHRIARLRIDQIIVSTEDH